MGSKMSLNLLKHYQKEVAEGQIQENPEQVHVLKVLDESWQQATKRSIFPWRRHALKSIHVYIYGSVGSGKTMMMDMFYQAIPGDKKARYHFHHFLEQIAQSLKALQGEKDPMKQIVKELAKQYQVVCLDEMMVQDVVQAMLLRELLPELMEQEVMLVLTSNIAPQDLYLNGLQRERFMTVIEHLQTYAHVMSLNLLTDYRSERLPMPEKTYLVQKDLLPLFKSYAKHMKQDIIFDTVLEVQNRQIPVKAITESMVWFDFENISEIPRCQRDYLEIASRFKMVFISQLRPFKESDSSSVILWIYLIDVFYDSHTKLVLESAANMEELYLQGPMAEPFKRTLSRMHEMQSQWYWDI
ncbi:MAG TPA: cell division protein ZapE [Legionellales bacterium]|nr:cell division protein ZapE [Legionellales bacterium]